MGADPGASVAGVADELRARIARDGPLTVRDFMAAANQAYYARGPEIGGEGGDFYTAANVSLFPNALARFVKAARERLGGIARVVELGGGRGDLAESLGEVTVVEPMVGLAKKQEARGLQVVASLADLRPVPSVVLANELLDALPVHRLHGTPDGAREGYVAWKDGRFIETHGPLSRSELAAFDVPTGAAREVCLEAGALLEAIARAAPKAIVLFLDYAAGPPKPGGTLRGFSRHAVTDPLDRPGEQDVTADVDFGHLADLAKARGFEVLGERAQGEFLADLGLLDDMMLAMSKGDTQAYLAGKNLLMPGGMGERFRVLCLGLGVRADPPLPGLRADMVPGSASRRL